MSMETTEITSTTVTEEEKEPIYFAPKRVTLVSDIAAILSWVVLVGFIGNVILQVMTLQAEIKSGGYAMAELIKEPSFIAVIFTNMLIPLLTGLVFFAVLQAAAAGLNMLLETDFNAHEAKK
jgi:O-antigen/teichoic acid export membrane protein